MAVDDRPVEGIPMFGYNPLEASAQPSGNDALMQLLGQLYQPAPQPMKPSAGRRVAAAIADAMSTYAAGIAPRGGIRPTQATAQLMGQYEAEKAEAGAAEERGRQMKGAALVSDFKVRQQAELDARLRHEKDVADAAKSYRDAMEKEDFERFKQGLQDKEDRRKEALNLISTGQMDSSFFSDENSPPSWRDIAKAQASLPKPEFMAGIRSQAGAGEQVSVSVTPGKSATFTVSKEGKERAGGGDTGEVSASEFRAMISTIRQSTRISVLPDYRNMPGLSPTQQQVLDDERSIKTASLLQIPKDIVKQIDPLVAGTYYANVIHGMLVKPDGGKNDKFTLRNHPVMRGELVEHDKERLTFSTLSTNLNSALIEARSGKVVSDAEYERLSNMLVNMSTFSYEQQVINAKEIIDFLEMKLKLATPNVEVQAIDDYKQLIYGRESQKMDFSLPDDEDTGLRIPPRR